MTDLDKLEELERKARVEPIEACDIRNLRVNTREYLCALRDAAPSIFAELRELRRIKKAFDAVASERVVVEKDFAGGPFETTATFDGGRCGSDADLLTAIEAALEGT